MNRRERVDFGIFRMSWSRCYRVLRLRVSRCKSLEYRGDFATGKSKGIKDGFATVRDFRRVFKAPLEMPGVFKKVVGRFLCFIADSDDDINLCVNKLFVSLRGMGGHVDADLFHDFDGERVDVADGVDACTIDFDEVVGGLAKESFGHLAVARVASTKYKYASCFHGGGS